MHLLEMICERQREVYSVENQLVYQILQNVQRWSLILLHCQRQQELYVGSYQCFVSFGHPGSLEVARGHQKWTDYFDVFKIKRVKGLQAADWCSIDKSLATSKPTEPTEVSEITEETNLFSNTS